MTQMGSSADSHRIECKRFRRAEACRRTDSSPFPFELEHSCSPSDNLKKAPALIFQPAL